MFAAARSRTTAALRLARSKPTQQHVATTRVAKRNMGGGGHWLEVSRTHTIAGEVCGFFTWLWIFYRAKHDLPVVLGLRHPWEHAEDPWAVKDHVENLEELRSDWEAFTEKATRPGEDDEEEEGDAEDENDEDDDDE